MFEKQYSDLILQSHGSLGFGLSFTKTLQNKMTKELS